MADLVQAIVSLEPGDGGFGIPHTASFMRIRRYPWLILAKMTSRRMFERAQSSARERRYAVMAAMASSTILCASSSSP